jgi:transposase InsO family protein
MCYGAEFTAREVRRRIAAVGARTAYIAPGSRCANGYVESFNARPREELVAPLVIDHPMNGVTFRACVEQHLAPTLSLGDFVVTDNLQGRKAPGVRAAIETRGAELRYLPLYSLT